MADFKQSSIYQIGVFHAQLGKLLMDPKTDMKKLTDFCHKYNIDFQFQFMPITPAEDPARTTKPEQADTGEKGK